MADTFDHSTSFDDHTSFLDDQSTVSQPTTSNVTLVTVDVTSSSSSSASFLLGSTLTIVYIVISVVGIVGNVLCLVVLLGHAPLRRRPANYFLISQSIIDLLVSILLPLNTSVVVPDFGPPFDALICYVWLSRPIFLGLFTASLFNITALAVERYFKTVHPVQHRIWMTKRRLLWVVVVVSVAGVLLKMPYAIGGTSIDADSRTCFVQTYPTQTIGLVVGLYNFLVEYFLPLLTIAFCYIQMARSLRRGGVRSAAPVASTDPPYRETAMARARRNILKTLLVVVLIFVACTTFKQTLLLVKVITNIPIDYYGLTFNVSQVMSFLVSCTNFFIYLLHYDAFKAGVRTMLFARCCRASSGSIRPQNDQTTCHPEATLDEGAF